MNRQPKGGMRGRLAPHTLFFIVWGLFFSGVTAGAADQVTTGETASTWSLEACIRYAWEHNPQLQISQLELEQYRLQQREQWASFSPMFNSGISTQLNRPTKEQDIFYWELSATLPLFEGGKRINRLRSSRWATSASEADLEGLREKLRIDITRNYLQSLLSMELLRVARESRITLQTQREHTHNLVEAGSLPYVSLLEVEAQLAQEIYRETEAQHQWQEDLLSLKHLMNLPDHLSFLPDTTWLDGASAYRQEDIQALFQQSQSYPTLRAARSRMEQSRHQWLASQGNLFPSLSLQTHYNAYSSQKIGVQLSLQWPIWQQGHTIRTIREARLAYQQAQLALLQTQQEHYQTLQLIIHEAACAYQQYLAACQNFQAQENAFGHLVHKFNLGLIDGTDYAIAHKQRVQARSEMLQSQYAYYFQCKILDYYWESGSTDCREP